MRSVVLRFLLVVLAFFLAGCAGSEPPANDRNGADADQVSSVVTKSVELGRLSVNTPGPGPHTFSVTVPAGGADNVRWQLTLAGPYITSSVTGHGCINANVNVAVVVSGTSTKGGSCSDLGAGPAEFTVNLTDPAVAFTAVIQGVVTEPRTSAP